CPPIRPPWNSTPYSFPCSPEPANERRNLHFTSSSPYPRAIGTKIAGAGAVTVTSAPHHGGPPPGHLLPRFLHQTVPWEFL
ncbi:unnamed protein product, partial [Urochloa humidicola]